MFTKIAPKRFLFSIFLIIAFIGITLTNLKEADQLFADAQNQISDSLGWLIILLTNGFLIFVIYLAFSKHKSLILGADQMQNQSSHD